MLYRVETGLHAGLDDTQGRKTAQHLRKALGLSVAQVRQIKVFTVDGLGEAQVRRLLDEGVWHDPILQRASLEPLPLLTPEPDWFVEVGFRPGVTDNEARTARNTAALVLDIYLTVEYGHPIPTVAENAQKAVIGAVEAMTGCSVEAVNIHVGGVTLA